VLLVLIIQGRFDFTSAVLCVAAGMLSSVVPYATDLIVLRRIRPAVFGIIMSLNPVLAALAGLLVLGQALTVWQTLAIAGIVAANIGAVTAPTKQGKVRDSYRRVSSPAIR
jgi:inner membrane transporter RhtA